MGPKRSVLSRQDFEIENVAIALSVFSVRKWYHRRLPHSEFTISEARLDERIKKGRLFYTLPRHGELDWFHQPGSLPVG